MNRVRFDIRSLLKDPRAQVFCVMLFCLVIIGSWSWYTYGEETTDNAIVRCDFVDVVSEVEGVLKSLKFSDNQYVNRGQKIVKVEDSIFKAGVMKAEANLQSAKSKYASIIERRKVAQIISKGNIESSKALYAASQSFIGSISAEIREIKARIQAIDVELSFLKEDRDRITKLFGDKLVSKREYEEANKLYNYKLSELDALKAKLDSIESRYSTESFRLVGVGADTDVTYKSATSILAELDAEVDATKSAIALYEAELELANVYLRRTEIVALRSGYITNRRVGEGEYMEIGQPIASITTCTESAWIEANFKETQIGRIKPGQKVSVQLDSYPGVNFTGKVEGVSNGSGATFSVLPPENAVGNFTKVVQRFPVKIKLEKSDYELRIGMSSVVTVELD